ncbi:hypothetical protein M3I54_17045 [Paraburkholderia sp. CNPSo 3274]|uniref:hypothetical protein n=1 Tax=Paraburkholderia sp. CNPSo 3274 TaxID=2940932 RepID=UPI0020B8385B|nr:hypothetical protein [Paraburkholderia sp. CNPSo 3274]MCP3708679.1 hypothetical protein [Paraburkholderia sp. CNPSo 3274]
MQRDTDNIPYYLVLRAGCLPYVLDVDRLILRREASLLLRAFAKSRATPTCISDDLWNDFSGAESISPLERTSVQAYALINGAESAHHLKLLASL